MTLAPLSVTSNVLSVYDEGTVVFVGVVSWGIGDTSITLPAHHFVARSKVKVGGVVLHFHLHEVNKYGFEILL